MAKKPLKGVRFTTAATVMKKNIVTIDGKETVADAIKLMREKKVSSLLVNRRGQDDAWGIVTRKDVVNKIVDPGKNPKEVKVFEIIPPIVDTDLDKGERKARGQANRGIPPTDVAKVTLPAMEADVYEIGIGMTQGLKAGSKSNFDEIFNNMNRGF